MEESNWTFQGALHRSCHHRTQHLSKGKILDRGHNRIYWDAHSSKDPEFMLRKSKDPVVLKQL
jgi:hypothetical protein